MVEHWSSNPEDAGSIPSRKALELHFSQLVPVLGLIMYILTTLEFPTHNIDFHLYNKWPGISRFQAGLINVWICKKSEWLIMAYSLLMFRLLIRGLGY